jgi:hypothetical protein
LPVLVLVSVFVPRLDATRNENEDGDEDEDEDG